MQTDKVSNENETSNGILGAVSNRAFINLKLNKMANKLDNKIEYEYDDFDDYDDTDENDYDDDFYERQQEELQERAMDCTCGAWKLGKSGEVYHVADCCCGAE